MCAIEVLGDPPIRFLWPPIAGGAEFVIRPQSGKPWPERRIDSRLGKVVLNCPAIKSMEGDPILLTVLLESCPIRCKLCRRGRLFAIYQYRQIARDAEAYLSELI